MDSSVERLATELVDILRDPEQKAGPSDIRGLAPLLILPALSDAEAQKHLPAAAQRLVLELFAEMQMTVDASAEAASEKLRAHYQAHPPNENLRRALRDKLIAAGRPEGVDPTLAAAIAKKIAEAGLLDAPTNVKEEFVGARGSALNLRAQLASKDK